MGKDFESRMVLLLAYVMLALLVMATAAQAPVTQPIIVKDPASAQNKAPNCSDGIQNQGEYGADCGGVCATGDAEVCDGIDNDRDCLIDEGKVCAPKSQLIPVSQSKQDSDYPNSIPALQDTGKSVSEVGSSNSAEASDGAEAVPASEESGESSATEWQKPQVGTVIDDAEEVTLLRRYIRDNNVYVPVTENDTELLQKYRLFTGKHEAEFETKYEGKELTEKEFAEILRQFSEETYPKKEENSQSKSFLSKVKGFFKRLFS